MPRFLESIYTLKKSLSSWFGDNKPSGPPAASGVNRNHNLTPFTGNLDCIYVLPPRPILAPMRRSILTQPGSKNTRARSGRTQQSLADLFETLDPDEKYNEIEVRRTNTTPLNP